MFACNAKQEKLSLESIKRLEDDCTRRIEELALRSIRGKELALVYNNRGYSKYLQVEFDSAVDDYNKALENDPMLAVAFYNRGTIHYRLGNFKAAFEDMEKALRLDQHNPEIVNGFDECKRVLGENTN